MPVEYVAFESANQIKLVFVGLNTRDDVASKYEMIMNLDGTIIEGNSNVKMTVTSIEPGDIDLSIYATKEELNDYALKSELPDTSGFVTTEALDTKADKTELENVVKYTDISDADDTPRKTIMLDNNDTLSAYNTTGTANNIAMISKWDVVDLGSTGLPINLNGSKERPTYNDSKELALVSDIPSMSEYATTAELTSLRSELQQTETGVATANSEIEKLQSGKQDLLVSGENIKTLDGESLLGEGDIQIRYPIANTSPDTRFPDMSIKLNQEGQPNSDYGETLDTITQKLYKGVDWIYMYPSTYLIYSISWSDHYYWIYAVNPHDPNEILDIAFSGSSMITQRRNLKNFQTTEDETLTTTDKTIVGAINELLTKIQELETKNTELESRLAALEGTN